MKLTWIDLNSWIFDLAGQTILVDPWLVDPLVFYGLPWLFTANHSQSPAYTPESLPPIDLILLSQGLDDHCHQPTLERLDRQIPVIASPTAAKVARALGYAKVSAIAHWQALEFSPTLQITAIPGAEIQPGQVENGYLLRDRSAGKTLYYEPHQFPNQVETKQQLGAIDVAITPVIGQIFPLLGEVIMGTEQALQMVEVLQPRFILPTTRGDIRASGILPMLVRSIGSVEEFRDRLIASGASTQLLVPNPGETMTLDWDA
jgi:L-ascorbate metabolism protein UlaG (beta-lactamase superfamily)